MQVWLLGRPFERSTDDQVVLYCPSLGHMSVKKNTQLTMYSAFVTSDNTLDSALNMSLALQVPS